MTKDTKLKKSKIIIDTPTNSGNQVVAIINSNNQLESFEFENVLKQTTKANIYLGRVLRVEHSLQAAFVEYGEDKAGFLPFSEIHPDYYQIPQSDVNEIKAKLREEDKKNLAESENLNEEDTDIDNNEDDASGSKSYYMLYKKYNIQEVIKRGQNVLVQVFKDSRGNKGCSLTTYISLAGRYCVLMPNSPRGIGISKKIHSHEERKRILNIIKNFNLPYGTGIIMRTAGIGMSSANLKKDYEYLVDLWNEIRANAVKSKICSLVYKECNIIEQVIRDNYDPDVIEEIVVSSKATYDSIILFMKKIIPQEIHKVKFYADNLPILKKYKITTELTKLLDERVELPSGGYIIINPTEALTAIDVNSGKMHEKNIEETALKTNLEAATEIAKQLKLRNIGGLIVADFIDMAELKNRKTIESELREAFATDKARVQFTRISPFGLIEISRQRIRSSVYDILTVPCSYCHGSSMIKAPSVIASDIFDSLNEQLQRIKSKPVALEIIGVDDIIDYFVEFYIDDVKKLEKKYNIKITAKTQLFKHHSEFVIQAINKDNGSLSVSELYHSLIEHKKPMHNLQSRSILKRFIVKLKKIINIIIFE